MKFKQVHQFSAGFNAGDAISNEMVAIRNYLKKLGYHGDIYSENISPSQSKIAKKYSSYRYTKNDLLIYHHSIHSSVLDFLLKIDAAKILIYHNVTPHEFFESYDLKLTYYLKKGREELWKIKNGFSSFYADSYYNKSELDRLGFVDVNVLPIVFDFSKMKRFPAESDKANKNILLVARIAPNKKQEDLIKFARVYYENYDKDFRLNLVGYCSRELLPYKKKLIALTEKYNLQEVVHFSDFVDDRTINHYYSNADLFITLSEHEGFCVPLIESMFHEVPIIAHNAGAVKETLGGAGVLFYEKNIPVLCEMTHRILNDSEFCRYIVEKQNKRLENFCRENTHESVMENLKTMLSGLS